MLAAGDTFRAAAVEQLQIWGERAGVPVIRARGARTRRAVAFDAMAQAEAMGADLLMIDTAGRLQNRADLMERAGKDRPRDPQEATRARRTTTLLVLDATTGQNAHSQVEIFREGRGCDRAS